MSETNQYLIFYIYSSDLAFIQSVQGSLIPIDTAGGITGNGVGAILAAPDDAAVKYAAPKLPAHSPVVAPGIASTWFGTEDHFPTNVASFDRKSGGWFGWSFLFGDTTHYHWRGIFVYVPPPDPVGGPTLQNIATRRWIDGFEIQAGGEGGGGGQSFIGRGGSRHVEGMGLMLRGSTTPHTHATNEYGGAAQASSWERFYIRIRKLPTASSTLFRAKQNLSPAAGVVIQITPTGQLAIFDMSAVSTLTFIATTPGPALDTWARIDIFLKWGGGVPAFEMWLNGTDVLQISGITSMAGLGVLHVSSEMGDTNANTLGCDVDDWMNADLPATTAGIDFQSGSAMFLITPTALDPASSVNWVGDYRALAQMPAGNAQASVTSATAAAALIALTDASEVIGENPEAVGLVAMVCSLKITGAQAANAVGFIGADLSGALTALGVAMTNGFLTFLWKLPATPTALKVTHPIKLTYNHGNAGASTVNSMLAVCELVGIFGPEDRPHVVPAPKTVPPSLGIHNAPYPRTPWARLTTTPQQPVLVVTGTYVGNGTGQDLHFAVPVHFFHTRPLAAEVGGAIWWSSLIGAHKAQEKQWQANALCDARINPAFVPAGLDLQQQDTILSIAGADPQSNQNAITYSYVAICDPGMRFLLNDALKHHVGTVDQVTTLVHPRYTPLAGFFFSESSGATTPQLWFKGPGNALQSITSIAGVETALAVQFGLATITNRSAFNALGVGDQVAIALFRIDDTGVGDAGKVFQIFTYTGDGAASRSLACTPASGKRPMWAYIQPHNAAGYYRDPSHAGVTSSQMNAGLIATLGITAGGIDSITVGSTLNANGIVYDVLVIPGDTVAGNNGWSVAGTFMPVDPNPPPDAPFDADSPQEPPDAPVDDPEAPAGPLPDPIAATGPMPGLTDDLAAACEPDTRRMINVALGRIGISKQIANVATDRSAESTSIRLNYNEAIQTTLRDFPWPFATRYAQLAVLNAGVRPNTDWRYAYRQPSDCLFERRLVVSRTDVANPDAVPFQLSSDFDPGDAAAEPPVASSGGGIIFTNLPNAVLEYTARPKCPHTKSEPLFRDAAAWKIAEMSAPALSRMTDATVMCAKAYQATIEQAYVVLRPGNAGDVPAAATVDVAAAAVVANLSVANAALIQIGAKTIRNLTSDQSREAQLVRIVFEQELRATLRDYPWPFATIYVTPVLVAGTLTVPVNADWQYSYRLPTDLVFARRLVTLRRRAYEPNPSPFKVAQDATGGLLFTDVETTAAQPIVLEYTNRPEGVVLVADPLFRDALAWRISWRLAPSLALLVPDRPEAVGRGPDESAEKTKERTATGNSLRARAADKARECYYFAIASARVGAAREAQPDETPVDASWISERD